MENNSGKALETAGQRTASWIWLSLAMMPALLAGMYALGFASDLGLNFLQENWLHEFFHDARHAAGFPCH